MAIGSNFPGAIYVDDGSEQVLAKVINVPPGSMKRNGQGVDLVPGGGLFGPATILPTGSRVIPTVPGVYEVAALTGDSTYTLPRLDTEPVNEGDVYLVEFTNLAGHAGIVAPSGAAGDTINGSASSITAAAAHIPLLFIAQPGTQNWRLISENNYAPLASPTFTGTVTAAALTTSGDVNHQGSKIGFYNTAAIVKPTVTGSKGANAALASLMTALAALGLVIDSTS